MSKSPHHPAPARPARLGRARPGQPPLWHRLVAALATLAITLGLFLVLPVLQTVSKPPGKDLLVRSVDVLHQPPPPPPPQPEQEEPEPEEQPPELTEQSQPLDLSQLEVALNPGFGDGLTGDFAVKLAGKTVADMMGDIGQIFSLADLDQKPRPIVQTQPVYPSELRRQNRQGTVYVLFVVDTTGRVTNPQADKATDEVFVKPAVDAVKQWRFEPGTRNGEKVRFKMRIPITFAAS